MEIIKSTDDLRRVEEGGGVVEPPSAPQVAEQLPASHVGEQHVEEALVFGAPREIHQEWMIDFLVKWRYFRLNHSAHSAQYRLTSMLVAS